MSTLGEKLERFYIQLVSAQSKTNNSFSAEQIHELLHALRLLDDHILSDHDGETPLVKEEILKDARKKVANVIRPYYIDTVNQLITSSTKRLRAKTALDNSIDHSQRHIYILLELLGTWSNIIAEIFAVGFEKEQVLFLLKAAYLAHSVLEACSDSSYSQIEPNVFLPQYQEDVFYLLEKAKSRLFDHVFDEQSVFALAQKLLEIVTITSQDNSIVPVQDKFSVVYCMVGFRSLFKSGINAVVDPNTQVTLFDNANHPVFHTMTCESLGKKRGEVEDRRREEIAVIKADSADPALPLTPQKTTAVSDSKNGSEEGGQTQWTTWLTNLASPYIPTHESSPSTVQSAQKLTPPNSTKTKGKDNDNVNKNAGSGVTLESLLISALELDVGANGGVGVSVGQAMGGYLTAEKGADTWQTRWGKHESINHKFYRDIDVWADISPEVNVKWTEKLWKGLQSNSNSANPASSHKSSQDLLTLFLGPTPYLDEKIGEYGGDGRDGKLLNRDEQVLYLNALGGVAKGIRGLAQMFVLVGDGKERGEYPSLAILSKEFSACLSGYDQMLNGALKGLISEQYYRYLQQPAHEFCKRSYRITGAEMESRYHNLSLVHLASLYLLQVRLRGGGDMTDEEYYRGFVREYRERVGSGGGWVNSIFQSVSTVSSWIGGSVAQTHHPPSHLTPPSSSTGIFSNSDSAQLPSTLSLTEDVWWEFLLCTAELLYDGIVLGGCIMEGQFNEWGALLLQQEVLQLIRYLSSLFSRAPDPFPGRHALLAQRITIICSLLAIDKPAYVESIALPAGLFRENRVKEILRRRVEFAEDSINTVKLTWKEN
eukprot:gene32932-39828_t